MSSWAHEEGVRVVDGCVELVRAIGTVTALSSGWSFPETLHLPQV